VKSCILTLGDFFVFIYLSFTEVRYSDPFLIPGKKDFSFQNYGGYPGWYPSFPRRDTTRRGRKARKAESSYSIGVSRCVPRLFSRKARKADRKTRKAFIDNLSAFPAESCGKPEICFSCSRENITVSPLFFILPGSFRKHMHHNRAGFFVAFGIPDPAKDILSLLIIEADSLRLILGLG